MPNSLTMRLLTSAVAGFIDSCACNVPQLRSNSVHPTAQLTICRFISVLVVDVSLSLLRARRHLVARHRERPVMGVVEINLNAVRHHSAAGNLAIIGEVHL